jgi:nicotinate phosphoribosyltransferase
LLFSDSLDFKKANAIKRHFDGRCNIAFGIGTYLANDAQINPLNIVMKVTECNGSPVAKISDCPGKGMCRDSAYVDYLNRAIGWRMSHENF